MELKSNAIDLTELAIGVVVLGLIVSIGANILLNFRDGQLSNLDVITTTNETLTFSSNTATLTNKWGKGVVSVTNVTTGATVGSGNYSISISSLDGTITITNTTSYLQPWYAKYQWYNTSRADYTLASDAATGISEYGNWFKIIVIVGVAAVVLSLIFMAFGNRSQSNGSY